VGLLLLSMQATSAATERNWALWGRVHGASRNALGMERAKKLITFLLMIDLVRVVCDLYMVRTMY
jgi:hypothetical protein